MRCLFRIYLSQVLSDVSHFDVKTVIHHYLVPGSDKVTLELIL